MIRQNAEVPTNGAPAVPSRLAMNRLGPQKASAPPLKKTAEPNGQGDDIAQNRLTAKKLAEEKARARTVARAQAVAEKKPEAARKPNPTAVKKLRIEVGRLEEQVAKLEAKQNELTAELEAPETY